MNIYAETNFILELVFQQEQAADCELILAQCEAEMHRLIFPAYCLAEPNEKLIRQARSRSELQRTLQRELDQLARSHSYSTRIDNIQDIASLLIRSNEEEWYRFDIYRRRLLGMAEIVPLTVDILRQATFYETSLQLQPQDAIVYASVIAHLSTEKPQGSCFLNRNSRDFDSPDIIAELSSYECRMIPRFDDGEQFLRARHSAL